MVRSIRRLHQSGVYSNSFGNNVVSSTYGVGLSLQSDGKIVLTKHKQNFPTESFTNILVVRLTTTGTLDTTFAGIGLYDAFD